MTPRGLGPLHAGMSRGAAAALGVRFPAPGAAEECRLVPIPGAPSGVLAMLVSDTLVRFDVLEPTGVRTPEGVGVGDLTDRVRAVYRGRVRLLPHKYTDGSYLIVTDPADTLRRIVFETDRTGRITRFRAGRFPEVEWVEGCG